MFELALALVCLITLLICLALLAAEPPREQGPRRAYTGRHHRPIHIGA